MIVFKWWKTSKKRGFYMHTYSWEGYFLFGIIPLYVRLVKETRT